MVKRLLSVIMITAFAMIDSLAQPKAAPPDAVDWCRGIVVSHVVSKVDIDRRGTPVHRESGSVVSLNRGRVNAYHRARDLALENIARLVREIRIDGDTMLSDLIEEDETAQRRIANVIATRVKVREFPTGFAESTCRAELKIGDILHAVPYAYPGDDFPVRTDNPIPTRYTSLVVDTRGLHVEPMILPSVYNENGLEVYGRNYVDIRYAGKYGIASYASTDDEAMKSRIAGDHPFYTVAIKELKGCPVISDRDIRKLFSSEETMGHLKKCRVIFIIDKKKKR